MSNNERGKVSHLNVEDKIILSNLIQVILFHKLLMLHCKADIKRILSRGWQKKYKTNIYVWLNSQRWWGIKTRGGPQLGIKKDR